MCVILQGRNLFFNDKESRIDYVLAWEIPTKDNEQSQRAKKAREMFEANLAEEGLKLEYDTVCEDFSLCKTDMPF